MPLFDAAKHSLRRFQGPASRRAAEVRRFVSLADFGEYRAARDFARRFGVSTHVFPDASDANFDMLPSWTDPRAGLIVDFGANEGSG